MQIKENKKVDENILVHDTDWIEINYVDNKNNGGKVILMYGTGFAIGSLQR